MDVALNEDLVLMEVDAKDKFDLLRQAAQCLQTHGYVKESYADAVIEREKVFATGLPTVMGDDTETVSVDCIFMLAMKEAHAQLTLLQNLMGILQDADALKLVKEGTSAKEICAFVKGRLSQVAE